MEETKKGRAPRELSLARRAKVHTWKNQYQSTLGFSLYPTFKLLKGHPLMDKRSRNWQIGGLSHSEGSNHPNWCILLQEFVHHGDSARPSSVVMRHVPPGDDSETRLVKRWTWAFGWTRLAYERGSEKNALVASPAARNLPKTLLNPPLKLPQTNPEPVWTKTS